MIKRITKYKKLPLVVGKSYPVQGQPGQTFLLKEIVMHKVKVKDVWVEKEYSYRGIYEKCSHLGICDLRIGGLVQELVEDGTMDICDKCKSPLHEGDINHTTT